MRCVRDGRCLRPAFESVGVAVHVLSNVAVLTEGRLITMNAALRAVSGSKNSKVLVAAEWFVPHRVHFAGIRLASVSALSALVLSLSGCGGVARTAVESMVVLRQPELNSGDAKAMNYSSAYIHRFGIQGPGRIGGGGGNVMPIEDSGRPSQAGEKCCISYPLEWQPDLKLTVRWLADKKQDGITPGYWYKAENVRIQQYDGKQAGGVWAIFLPGDRVKIVVADGNANGHNTVSVRPADGDPYVVQGAVDDEWNRLYRKGGSQ